MDNKMLEKFEKELMDAVLAGNDPILEILREQYKRATKNEKESYFQEKEFLINFEVPREAPLVSRKRYKKNRTWLRPFHYHFQLADVYVEFPETESACHVSLFLNPSMERMSFVDSSMLLKGTAFPNELKDFIISYRTPIVANYEGPLQWKMVAERDMKYVKEVWRNIWGTGSFFEKFF